VAIIVYDITKLDSFDTLKKWIDELQQSAPPNIITAVVGNKIDLVDQQVVDYQLALNFAKANSNPSCTDSL
jgi:GTPase SAR1 family protein